MEISLLCNTFPSFLASFRRLLVGCSVFSCPLLFPAKMPHFLPDSYPISPIMVCIHWNISSITTYSLSAIGLKRNTSINSPTMILI